MEILNVRALSDGYLVNGHITVLPTDPNYSQVSEWVNAGKEVMPMYTPGELEQQSIVDKWESVNIARSTLTVETAAGNVFAASPDAILSIYRKEASMLSTDSCIWYEDDGVSFSVTKVELQEALNLANAADQNLLDTLLS